MEMGLVTVTLFTEIRPSLIETKIQEESVTVKLFLKLFFAVVDLFGVNLASDRVQFSPEFADFDGSFHTSSINLP
jgi:hypothetical protein